MENTNLMIERLLQELKEEKGKDLMGVLLDTVRMEHAWRLQKKDVNCIQECLSTLRRVEPQWEE